MSVTNYSRLQCNAKFDWLVIERSFMMNFTCLTHWLLQQMHFMSVRVRFLSLEINKIEGFK